MSDKLGEFSLNKVYLGDCIDLISNLPDESIDILVTSPPYWGQRTSLGMGTENDPREYIEFLKQTFEKFLPKLKKQGIVWINIGDAYNTPVNWTEKDRMYSTLGADKLGLSADNSAYKKNRAKRKAFLDKDVEWLKYGNLLALTYRMVLSLVDSGYFFRGEVIWKKLNPMPEGRCRRPHRSHEPIYLLTKSERHQFRTKPPVKSVWEFPNEHIKGKKHYSRFPIALPQNCIEAYGELGPDVVVLDPFSGSGTTGIAALQLGCSYIGFEINEEQVEASNYRLNKILVDKKNLEIDKKIAESSSTEKNGYENLPLFIAEK